MVTLTRKEIWKIIHTIEDAIIEYERMARRSSPETAERMANNNSDLFRIKMQLRDALDYNAKRIAVE